MHIRRPVLLLTALALVLPTSAAASVSAWQTCSVGPAGDTALCTSGGFPQQLTSAAGSLWVTSGEDVIQVSAAPTTAGAMTFIPVPAPATGTNGIVGGIDPGPDGALWFAMSSASRIGRLTTTGSFSFFPMNEFPSLKVRGARDVARGPDGAMWVTRYSGGVITRVALDGSTTDFDLPGGDTFVALQELVSGPGSRLWYIRTGQRAIGAISTSGVATSYTLPAGIAYASDLTEGPDGAIWFTAVTNSSPRRGIVGRLAKDGTYRLFDLGSYVPRAIHNDGSQLWVGSEIVGSTGHGLARMTTGGTITRFEPLPYRPDISDIVTGPDGAIWFTDLSGAQVGRIDGSEAPTVGAPSPVAIDPASLEISGTSASVSVDVSADATLNVQAALRVSDLAVSASKVRGAKRVFVPLVRTVGKRTTSVTSGKRRITVPLTLSARRALKQGARLKVAIRATEASKRRTLVQATLRAR